MVFKGFLVFQFKQFFIRLFDAFSALAVLSIITVMTLDIWMQFSLFQTVLFQAIYLYLYLFFCLDIFCRVLLHRKYFYYFKRHLWELTIFLPLIVGYFYPAGYFNFLFGVLFLFIFLRFGHLNQLFRFYTIEPGKFFLLGFVFVIFFGSLLLQLPYASINHGSISFLDALFTATSAVCVTGLTVQNVADTFSLFGQCVIMALIQVGGLGIMTFSILLTMVLHRRVSQRVSQEYQRSFATFNLNDTFQAIGFIFKVTFMIEGIGFLLLCFFWKDRFDSLSELFFYSFFHAISAFCNAGFSLFRDGLFGFVSDVPVILTFSFLIIIGGLGFPVLYNLFMVRRAKRSFSFLRLQTKIALIVTLVMIVFGTFFIWFGEFSHSFSGLSWKDQFLISFFHSVSARTTGFSSFDLALFHPSTLMVMIVLMLVGASPGSTGGGLKTTTVGVLLISFWQTVKSSQDIQMSGRQIPMDVILKALSIIILFLLTGFGFFYVLLRIESFQFAPLLFEVFSALGTVGYSLGVTEELSKWGKMLIMVLMFIGRLGPLTVAFALSRKKLSLNYKYPEESLTII